jgi:uncharacterized protein (TIGR00369 family)
MDVPRRGAPVQRNLVNAVTEINAGPDGFTQLRAALAGGLKAPIGELLGFELVEVERGQVVFEGRPNRTVYNPLGAVHGGYIATLLDSACGMSVHTTLGRDRGHTTLELKVSYLRGLTDQSGVVRATGRVLSTGRRVAFSEATLHDGEGRLCATATSTLLVFDVKAGGRGSPQFGQSPESPS